MLHPLIGRHARVEPWVHYPRHDVIDRAGQWQFYYHAHEAHDAGRSHAGTSHAGAGAGDTADAGAPAGAEHGHLHLFSRRAQGGLSHVAGLSLDALGTPLCWFSTNRWVTGEHWEPADTLIRRLESMELPVYGPLAGVAAWLADLARFYATRLQCLLHARDEAFAAHARRQGLSREEAFEDRRLAVLSLEPVQWPQDALISP